MFDHFAAEFLISEIPFGQGDMMTENTATPTARPRLRRSDVPAYLASTHGIDVAVSTLATWATVGGGPAMQYSGRIPLYPITELDLWATERLSKTVRSTSEQR
ncbi:hypothetical protein [Rhizobium brockwellii]